MQDNYSSLTDALNKKNEEVTNIINSMTEAGTSPFQCKLVEDALRHVFQGIMLARVQSIDPTEVEDGLINIFSIGFMEMLSVRQVPDVASATALAQGVIDDLAKLLAESITDKYESKIIHPSKAN